MGNEPDEIETKYCSTCGKNTQHNIYKSSYQEDYWEKSDPLSYPTKKYHTYTKTKQVCTECGKTKRKTTEDCCQII